MPGILYALSLVRGAEFKSLKAQAENNYSSHILQQQLVLVGTYLPSYEPLRYRLRKSFQREITFHFQVLVYL